MARIRSIKPEFWVSEQIAECSTSARLTFVGLWNFCDDRGVHPAKPRTLKAELFPMDDFTTEHIAAWMEELIKAGLVELFTAEGQDYWAVTGWAQHQKIDRPSCKHPEPPGYSATSRRTLDAGSTNTDEASSSATPRIGMERIGEEGRVDSTKSSNDIGVPLASDPPVSQAAKSVKGRKPAETRLPDGFAVSDRVRAWAESKGFDRLDQHLEHFTGWARAKGAVYADWDQAFQNAIRGDWGGIRSGKASTPSSNSNPWEGAR